MVRRTNVDISKMDELSGIESYLQNLLKPVTPRPKFVSGLGERLLQTPIPPARWVTFLGYTALISAGLISGAIILATGVRAVLAVIGALGVAHQIKEQKYQNRLA